MPASVFVPGFRQIFQEKFKTFSRHKAKRLSRPKVKNVTPNATPKNLTMLRTLRMLQTHTLLRQPSGNTCWKACACMPACYRFETICLLDRTTRHSITQKTFSKFCRTRSLIVTTTSTEVFEEIACSVIAARCGHGHWTVASVTQIGRESDCRTGRAENKKSQSSMCPLLGQVRQLASFPQCETFPRILRAIDSLR